MRMIRLLCCLLFCTVTTLVSSKQLYHVTLPRAFFESTVMETFEEELDIWEINLVKEQDQVVLDVYTSEEFVETLKELLVIEGYNSLLESEMPIQIKRDAINTQWLMKQEKTEGLACQNETLGHLEDLKNDTKSYVTNAFFDCWREAHEIFAFLDELVALNPNLLSKIDQVSFTVEGRIIPAYKISSGPSTNSLKEKKSLYTQGLIHAREWHAGSSTFYSMAGFLDGLRTKEPSIVQIFEEYDWYFVPIVNIDGFIFTWDNNRLWRKNRRVFSLPNNTQAIGVDLNRNFGPAEYFNRDNKPPNAGTYPGPYPLSEPETAGIYHYLKTLPDLKGAIDIHSYSGLVLRPYGFQKPEAIEPFGSRIKKLGDNVRDAIMLNNNETYVSQTAAKLYLAYGTFMDCVFSEFNFTASLSFETEGQGFLQPRRFIRPAGLHIFQGLKQFAYELEAYYA